MTANRIVLHLQLILQTPLIIGHVSVENSPAVSCRTLQLFCGFHCYLKEELRPAFQAAMCATCSAH
jgi:hypothetical protein